MAFCTDCGTNVPDGIKFCTECGKTMGEADQPVPVMAAAAPARQSVPATPAQSPVYAAAQQVYAPQPMPQPQAVPVHPIYNGDALPPPDSKYAVMSTGSYIGHGLLFGIPLIGWLICLIMAFASSKLNKRNFARAILIFFLIGLVISVILYFVFGWISEVIMGSINEAAGGALGDTDSIKGLFRLIK